MKNLKYKTLFDLWKQSCKKYENNILFTDDKEELTITYKQAYREICFLAEKFLELGIKRHDNVCLFAANSPRWLIVEQAIITIGGICVSKNSDINIKELEYVFNNAEAVILITDKKEIINHFKNKLENIKFVLYIGKEDISDIPEKKVLKLSNLLKKLTESTVIKENWQDTPDDIAYINYTSGTSSMPKGAMLQNVGMAYVVEELQKFNKNEEGKTFVVTFPLSSAGGKSFNLVCLASGCRIMYTKYSNFYNVIKKYQPDYLHCAPKIIQTMHSMLMEKVKEKGIIFEKAFELIYSVSKLILHTERTYLYKNKLLFLEKLINKIKKAIDKRIYKQIRNILLKDDITIFVGSAHLAKPLEDFFEIFGLTLIQHYGLTETTGLDVSNTIESQKRHPYTVGVPFSKTIVRVIDPETHKEVEKTSVGLITLGGMEILKGYYKNEEATKKALLENGFLNTGDLGYIDENGYLVILSRYDDVIVMSNGYNVYTPLLENEAKDSEYVNQLVITGHGQPYLTSLIVLNQVAYNNWCKENSIKDTESNKNKKFKEFIIEHINEKIKRKNDHKYYEKIKKVYFLKEEFTIENGMLTSTLKVKYRKICNTYKKEIEKLYKEK